MLHTREFDVNGQKIIVGHDRETGKRYYVDNIGNKFDVFEIKALEFVHGENYIQLINDAGYVQLFQDVENPEKTVAELKSIFWIE